jgi:hypothetical protein
MNELPGRRQQERSMTPATQNLQSSAKSTGLVANAVSAGWRALAGLLSDPVLLAISIFCIIGLLITINLIARFPDFTAVNELFGQYP